MTDEEAYELLIEYSSEETLIMQKEMIRSVGVEKTSEFILSNYSKTPPDDFKNWLLQALSYLNKQILKSQN